MIETAADLDEFFLTEDFAVTCELTGPAAFAATFPVIHNATTETIDAYDTNIEAANEHFICTRAAVAGLDRRQLKQYLATLEGVTYRLERIENEADGKTVLVYLKK